MQKIKVGDTVKVRSGKDKGREGKVERVYAKAGRLIVANVNIYKKHVKGRAGVKSGIYELPRSLPASAVSLVCPNCKKQTSVKFKLEGTEKVRICKKCGRQIESGAKNKK